MGTFHDDTDDLHGLTVAVFSSTPRTYIGRWDKDEQGFVLLHDATFHEEGQEGDSRDEWLEKMRTFGVAVQYPHLTIPSEDVTEVVRLREVKLPGE